jgi:hypothetical protein
MEGDTPTRRSVLATIGVTGSSFALSGCLNSLNSTADDDNQDSPPTDSGESTPSSTRNLPAECPKSTLELDLPDEITKERAEEFVVNYEEQYRPRDFVIQHPRDTVGVRVDDTEPTGAGYVVRVSGSGYDYRTVVDIRASVEETTGEATPVTDIESEILRDVVREAVQGDGVASPSWEGSSLEDALPDGVHDAYMSVPSTGSRRVVAVENTTVTLDIRTHEPHETPSVEAAYYIDSQVLYRTGFPQEDPRDETYGMVLECR